MAAGSEDVLSNIVCAGEGAPTLILVQGGGCDAEDWRAQVHALSSHFRVVTFDLRGYAGPQKGGTAGIQALARAIVRAKLHCASDQSVLIGHGMGCRLILEAYRQSPEDIVGLALFEGSLLAQGDPRTAVDAAAARVDAAGIDAFLKAAFESMFVSSSDAAMRQHILKRTERWDRDYARQLFLSAVRWDANNAAQILDTVRVPVLAISRAERAAGERSGRSISPWIDLLQTKVGNLEVLQLGGVGHFVQIEAADTVNERIELFARRCAAGSRPSACDVAHTDASADELRCGQH